jgi:hypothetical protein
MQIRAMTRAYQVSNGKERKLCVLQLKVTCALLAAVIRIASQEGCLRGAFSASRRCSHALPSSSAGAPMESDREIIFNQKWVKCSRGKRCSDGKVSLLCAVKLVCMVWRSGSRVEWGSGRRNTKRVAVASGCEVGAGRTLVI